jgi:release factor glutamine methyltransferase
VTAVVERLRAAGVVFAEEEAVLLEEAASGPALESLVTRRAAGEPLEPLLGWAAFDGLRVLVDPHVFVPRRRTELLARAAAARAASGSVVVDLCCGTGAVGLAVARRVPGVELHAADLDPAAAANARRNLDGLGAVHEGDLLGALPEGLRGRVDVLAVNAPYVPSDRVQDMPREARDFEPRLALDGGEGGLAFHRRLAAEAPAWLAPGGALLVETGRTQAAWTALLLEGGGLDVSVETDDEVDGTVAIGRRPGGGAGGVRHDR